MNKKLASLHPQSNVIVIGATGGIGRAIVAHLQQDPDVAAIHAFSRVPLEDAGDKVIVGQIDLLDDASIADAAAVSSSEQPIDLVIVATGILHRGDELGPEKSMRDLESIEMLEVLKINTVGPAIVARHMLPHMRRGQKNVFAALSARVGSIGDNRLGGWASYRASKAALNMLLRTLSIEQTRRSADSIVVGLHPGTVDTQLSAPFTSRVPAEKLFSPDRAASQLIDVIEGLNPADTGGVFAWDGSRIAY